MKPRSFTTTNSQSLHNTRMADTTDFWISESAEKILGEATNEVRQIVNMIETIDLVTPQHLLEFYKTLEENTNKLRRLLKDVKVTRSIKVDDHEEGLWVPAEVENTIARATFLVGRIAVLAMQLKNTPFKELNTKHRMLIKQAREACHLLNGIEVKASESTMEEDVKDETPNMDQDVSYLDDNATSSKKKNSGLQEKVDQKSKPRTVTRRKARMGSPESPIILASDDADSSYETEDSDNDWSLPSPRKKKGKRNHANGKKKKQTSRSKSGLNSDLDSDDDA